MSTGQQSALADWPSAIEYRDALQHPERAFCDPTLMKCRAETNKMGVPRARAGSFANVYKMMQGTSPYKAVRVFLYKGPEREERYDLVSRHLQQLRQNRPRCIVGFNYEIRGIRVNGKWFPILTMDWVKGTSLYVWVHECAQRRESRKLAQMAEHWAHLIEDLKKGQIAHGDLQHDNVMVVNDQPVLVDYDCMCVPDLVGRPALEMGKPAYQHPLRKDQKLSLDLDHFSAWIILLALRALAADLSLYDRYIERPKNENLLFSEADILQPGRSPLWQELLTFRDSEVKAWALKLKQTLPNAPFDRIPPFELDPFDELRKLCQARPAPWEEICREADRVSRGAAGKPFPNDLKGPVEDGRRRIACRQAVEKAIQTRSLRQLLNAYNPALLDDWSTCTALVTRARAARTLQPALDQLETALQQVGNGRSLVDLWNQHGSRLKDFIESDRIAAQALDWKKRIDACDAFLRVIKSTGATERAIAEAWDRLRAERGEQHPDAAPHRQRAEQARTRAALLDQLRGMPAADTEDADRLFERAWDETLLHGCSEAQPLRPRLDTARRRLPLADALRLAITQVNQGQREEQAIVDAAALLPGSYLPSLVSRVETARKRVATAAMLDRALQASSDCDLASAYDQARAAGPVRRAPADLQRCETAVLRRDCLRKLQAIPTSLPLEEQDRRWVTSWDDALLASCPDAAPARTRLDLARQRLDLHTALTKAITEADQEGGSEEAVCAAAAALPNGYAMTLGARIEAARKRLTAAAMLDRALKALPFSDCALAEAYSQARMTGWIRCSPEELQRCEIASQRRDCLRKLQAIPASLSLDEQDRHWCAVWDTALLADCPDAAPAQNRHDLARKRLEFLDTLLKAIAEADQERGTEEAVCTAAANLPSGYVPTLGSRVEAARKRVAAAALVDRSLQASSDCDLASAYDQAKAAGPVRLAPADLQCCETAVCRRDCLRKLHAIPTSLPLEEQDRRWVATWDTDLLASCPDAAQARTRHDLARQRLDHLASLTKAITEADQKRGTEEAVCEAAAGLPRGYAPTLGSRIEAARKRLAAAELLNRALRASSPSDCALADAYVQARAAGPVRCASGDLQRCETAVRRRDCLRKLQAIPMSLPLDEQDRRWRAAWDAPLLRGCPDSARYQARYDLALVRLDLLATLTKAINEADQKRGSEEAVRDAAARLPDGFAPALVSRLEIAKTRLAAAAVLDQAMKAASDCALADAYDQARLAGPVRRSSEDLQRCEIAVRRRDCLRKVQAIPTSLPLDEQDHIWHKTWDDALLTGCADAVPYQARSRLAQERLQAWKELEEVLGRQDLMALVKAAVRPILKGYPPLLRRRAEIEVLLRLAKLLQRMKTRQKQKGSAGELMTSEDLAFLRDNQNLLEPYRALVESLCKDWLSRLPLEPGTPPFRPASGDRDAIALWNWPGFGLIDSCRVAQDPARWYETPDEAPDRMMNWTMDNHRSCAGGVPVPNLFDVAHIYVTVWPVLDLGWLQVDGRPLQLGPVPVQ